MLARNKTAPVIQIEISETFDLLTFVSTDYVQFLRFEMSKQVTLAFFVP